MQKIKKKQCWRNAFYAAVSFSYKDHSHIKTGTGAPNKIDMFSIFDSLIQANKARNNMLQAHKKLIQLLELNLVVK